LIFETLFSVAKHLEEVREGLIYSNVVEPCSICGFPTHFVEINYQGYFCSSECVDKMDQESDKCE
jgi:hypothetical protein